MKFPLFVCDPLNAELQARWRKYFLKSGGRNRTIEEGIWRRTQEASNASESGWRSEGDARRRLVHYYHNFGLVESADGPRLALTSIYLSQSISLPQSELIGFYERIVSALNRGGWKPDGSGEWVRDDLLCRITRYRHHPQDTHVHRTLPNDYQSLDVTVESAPCLMPADRRQMPWDVLARGIRRRDQRGAPTIVPTIAPLAQLVPFQVELGCGISTEAGIPPLHFLHSLYSVSGADNGRFVFGGSDDNLLSQILGDPEVSLLARAQMMHSCLKAEPTQAHDILCELAARGLLLGPVITNNFDGLHTRVGLDECYIRRYDEDVPDVPIHEETNALLVIGSHADRRKVQKRFRQRGLPIFFLDPEGFDTTTGFRPYPIEGARDEDFIRHAGATAGLLELAAELGLYAER